MSLICDHRFLRFTEPAAVFLTVICSVQCYHANNLVIPGFLAVAAMLSSFHWLERKIFH